LPQRQQQPQQQEDQSGKPPGLKFEDFAGVNTSTTRTGVPDQQAYWLDGFMPLAPRNLRTLWGVGSQLYSAPAGVTIVFYFFFNLKAAEYVAIFLSDGSAVQVNTATGAQTTIMATHTISTPSVTSIGCSQYGQQYLVIVANQVNGYWIWNGTTLFGAGSLSPTTSLTNLGGGYTAPPLVTASGGHGSGATFVATITNGLVTSVVPINAGSGYLPTDVVTLNFTGGNSAGTGASLVANMVFLGSGTAASISLSFSFYGQDTVLGATWVVSGIQINNPGSGYTTAAQVFVGGPVLGFGFVNGSSSGWEIGAPSIAITSLGPTGQITGVRVVDNPANSPPFFFVYGGGAPSAPVTVSSPSGAIFGVGSVTVAAGGSNYSSSISVVASGGSPFTPATLSPTVLNGVIVAVTVVNSGTYANSNPPAISVTNNVVTNAAGTATLMPQGIQGTAVSTFQQHVWVFNGANFNFTAPGSVIDFSTTDGGGSQQSNSNQLRVGYTQVISALGFMFLIGDSSMDYISNVQTSGSGTTTYSLNNADPETGSPYPASVTTLGLDVIVANPNGIWSSSSGAPFRRISEPLDGVYNTVPAAGFNLNPFNGFQVSVAKATIFDKRVLMMLVPIVDPVSGQQANKLLMTQDTKRWWASTQDQPLTFIATQEINSVYIAWGTDGVHLYPLFQTPSSVFTKTAQSRLWDMPAGYDFTKSIVNLFAIAEFYGVSDLQYAVTVDSENGSTAPYIGTVNSAIWDNVADVDVQWTNQVGQPVTWLESGTTNVLQPTAVAQVGVLNGLTISTQCDDMAIVSAMLQPEIVQYRA
jgi:hypothetical protein